MVMKRWAFEAKNVADPDPNEAACYFCNRLISTTSESHPKPFKPWFLDTICFLKKYAGVKLLFFTNFSRFSHFSVGFRVTLILY